MTSLDSAALDVSRLETGAVAARVEWHASLDSTQTRAHQLAREGGSPLPLLVVAEAQTAGRGRGVNRWWTGAGSLAMSLLFDPAQWDLPAEPAPQRSLAAGVAIVDTVSPLIPRHTLGLHWPNDVFADGKKLAGVLIDVLPRGLHVVGIGLNVNNSLDGAPDEVRARATSLAALAGATFDRTTVLLSLLENLQSAICRCGDEAFGRRFDQLCLQIGRPLTVEVGGQQVQGVCEGIAIDGALLLATASGTRRLYSGVLR